MPYINPAQLIEPYLRPLGKQIINQIPGTQQERRASEELGARKSVWAEQIAESEANRAVQRDAQSRQMELLGLAATNPEAFAKLVPPGTDPETLLKLRFSGAMSPLQAQYPKAHTPSWKKVARLNEQGQEVVEWVDVAAPGAQGQQYVQPESVAEKRLKLLRTKHISDVEHKKSDRRDKRLKEDLKYVQGEIEYAIETDDQNYLTEMKNEAADLVGQSTSGIERDPEIDKTRAMIMEANERLRLYEKASQAPEDMGAALSQGLSMSEPQPVPKRQFVMPPKKEDEGPKEPTFTEKRGTAKDVAKAEEAIVNTENEGNPALVGPISIFNRYSNKPYMYIWKTEKQKKGILLWKKDVDVGKTQKIDLPVLNGKQVTAKEVWFTAQENGVTMEEVLKRIGAIE